MSTTTSATKRSDAWEWRRRRAGELAPQGWWQKDLAAALGVSRAAVCQWLQRARAGGEAALRTRPRPGSPPKLTAEQKARIPALLAQGAAAHGSRGDVWTARRVADLIGRTFGGHYHPDYVGQLLRQAGWSRQQPHPQATPRDARAIERWYEERWPALQAKRPRKGPPSSGSMRRASLSSRSPYAPGRRAAGPRSCACS